MEKSIFKVFINLIILFCDKDKYYRNGFKTKEIV